MHLYFPEFGGLFHFIFFKKKTHVVQFQTVKIHLEIYQFLFFLFFFKLPFNLITRKVQLELEGKHSKKPTVYNLQFWEGLISLRTPAEMQWAASLQELFWTSYYIQLSIKPWDETAWTTYFP